MISDWQTASDTEIGRAIALPRLDSMGSWILLKTKPACEHKALRNLVSLDKMLLEHGRTGIEAYLPLSAEIRPSGRRDSKQYWPMFSGYIFARRRDEIDCAFPSIYGIIGPVEFGGRPARVDEEIILELRQRETSAGVIDLAEECLKSIQPGDQVKIAGGPLAGFIGKLARLNGRERAVVLLEFLGNKRQEVEVPSSHLRLA